MNASLIKCGNKVELNIEMPKPSYTYETVEQKHVTSIYDFDEENLIVYMPMKKGKIILIPNGMQMEMTLHSEKGLFKATAVVRERYKKGNIFLMTLELKSPLTKIQRRDYYRCACSITCDFRVMSDNPALVPISWETIDQYMEDAGTSEIYSGTILDISGGGVRLHCTKEVEKGRTLLLSFCLENPHNMTEMLLFGKVLSSTKDTILSIFEERIEFVQISESEREKIVKFIFEEERRARSLRKG